MMTDDDKAWLTVYEMLKAHGLLRIERGRKWIGFDPHKDWNKTDYYKNLKRTRHNDSPGDWEWDAARIYMAKKHCDD